MKKNHYAFLFYDIADIETEAGKNRVTKVFKVCKKYFSHHQKSIFRGEITPANLIKLTHELKKIIDKDHDFITLLKFANENSFDEEILGTSPHGENPIFL